MKELQKNFVGVLNSFINKESSHQHTQFILDNLQKFMELIAVLGISESSFGNFMKKYNSLVEDYISKLSTKEFMKREILFNKMMDKNSPLLEEKNNLVAFEREVSNMEYSHVSFIYNAQKHDIDGLLRILDKIDTKKIEDPQRFIVDILFCPSGWRYDMAKHSESMLPLYEHPNVIKMAKDLFGTSKIDKEMVEANVVATINAITEESLINIYPKGDFGVIKSSEQIQLLEKIASVINLYDLKINKSDIKETKKLKSFCHQYSKSSNTQEVSAEKYQKIQDNIDKFLLSISKKPTKTALNSYKEPSIDCQVENSMNSKGTVRKLKP